MQYLKLPVDYLKPTAGYRNLTYREYWGYPHYGMDVVSANGKIALYGLGNGYVAAAGLDGCNGKTTGTGSGCGFVLIVIYEDVYNRKTKKSCDLVCTYMHMKAMPKVKKGDKVTKDTLLGYMGNTGACTTGTHLHIQFDEDTKYPRYCSGISSTGHNLLKHGTVDSTVNPTEVIFIGEGQKVVIGSSKWYEASDFKAICNMPKTVSTASGTTGRVIIG